MKRLAMAVMLAALAIAPAAVADPRHGDGHFEGGRVGGYGGYNRGGFPGAGGFGGRGGFGYHGNGGYQGGGEYRVAPRFVVPSQQPVRRYGYGGYAPPERYGPTPVAPTPAPNYESWRRGQQLSPAYRGAVVNDYQRYHLRRPPRGYYWTRVGEDFVLTAQGSGLVFDVIGADGR